jgi:hypothetical protein
LTIFLCSSDAFDLPQRQAAQEAQDRELDERRLQGIDALSCPYPLYSMVS